MQYYATSQIPQPIVPKKQDPYKQIQSQIANFMISNLVSFSSLLAAATILVTYVIAASKKDVPWWPVMITDTAKQYPEYIIFRIGMMFPIFLWLIQVVVVYFWLNLEKSENASSPKVPFYLNYMPWVGLGSYSVAIATIDNCQMNDTIHGVSSVIFFITFVLYTIILTLFISEVRKTNPEFISKHSWSTKKWLTILYVGPIAAVIAAAFKQNWGIPVAEWTATYIVIFYLRSFAEDFEGYVFQIDDTTKNIALVKKSTLLKKFTQEVQQPKQTQNTYLLQQPYHQIQQHQQQQQHFQPQQISHLQQNLLMGVPMQQQQQLLHHPVVQYHVSPINQHPATIVGVPLYGN